MSRFNPALKTLIFVAFSLLAFFGCNTNGEKVPLEEVDFEPEIVRLDLSMRAAAHALQEGNRNDSAAIITEHILPQKKFFEEYLYRNNPMSDSVLIGDFTFFLSDSATLELLDAVATRFPADYDFTSHFLNPSKRFTWYFPDKPFPKIVTFVSGYSQGGPQAMDQIVFTGGHLGIGLHFFLGEDYKYYPPDIPQFIRRRCTPEHIESLAFHEMANALVAPPKITDSPTLLDNMVYAGIKTQIVAELLPNHDDSLIIFYDAREMEWAGFFEAKVFIDMKQDLFSVDTRVFSMYMDESPFTKSLSRESAPRMGQYIGWKIVQAYLKENPQTDLQELANTTDFRSLFNQAKYKPRQPES